MTNEDLLQDLKQFISATVRAEVTSVVQESEARLRGEMGGKIDGLGDELKGSIQQVRKELDEGFAVVGEWIDLIHIRLDEHDDGLADQDRRIKRLEQRAS